MMNSIFLATKTPSGLLDYSLFCDKHVTSFITKYVNKAKYDYLCMDGCPNYNKKWSCPPFSPNYIKFTENYEDVLIVALTIKMDQFTYIKNDYLKIKAANTILKSRIDKALRSLINDDTYYISTGSCRLCKPCKCQKGQPCAHPDIMTYSLESLGINVGEMVKELFGFELQWYSKGHLPEYTSVVAALISNDQINSTDIYDALIAQK